MKKLLALIVSLSLLAVLPLSGGAVAAVPAPADVAHVLYGYVTGSDGSFLANVTISLEDDTGNISLETLTNDTGEYRFSLPLGNYNISAALVNFTANTTYSLVNLTSLVQGPYNFTMSEVLGAVTGYITDGERPIYGVTVTLSNEESTYNAVTTQPLGRYDMAGLKPGIYVAYAVKRGYDNTSSPFPIKIERGMTEDVNFTMQEQPARVYGTVYGETNKPLSGVKVELVSSDYSASAITDANGNYSISGIPVGVYEIEFTLADHYDKSSSISFDPFESKRMDESLSKVKKNATAVLFGYDLVHSTMIVGFVVGLTIVILGVFISIRAQKRPEMLARLEHEDEEEEKE